MARLNAIPHIKTPKGEMMPSGITRAAAVLAVVALWVALGGCASTPQGQDGFVHAAQPVLALETNDLRPGLAVLYFKHGFVRSLDALPQGEDARNQGWPGPPVPYLNHQFGRGEILASGTNRGIAMEFSGYIRLEEAGLYRFQINSNDGVRLYVDDHVLIDDPEWHSDRLSPEALLTVTTPGWHSLRLRYFQRKGTAALQLYWKHPGANRFSIVPARVLAHRQPY